MTDADPSSPLTPAVLHILLSLATEERHGYGIMKQVAADSAGLGTRTGCIGRWIMGVYRKGVYCKNGGPVT